MKDNKLTPAGQDNPQLVTRTQSQTYCDDALFKDKLLSLTVIFSCMLHNKLLTSKTLPGFIETEFISNAAGVMDRNKYNNTGTIF